MRVALVDKIGEEELIRELERELERLGQVMVLEDAEVLLRPVLVAGSIRRPLGLMLEPEEIAEFLGESKDVIKLAEKAGLDVAGLVRLVSVNGINDPLLDDEELVREYVSYHFEPVTAPGEVTVVTCPGIPSTGATAVCCSGLTETVIVLWPEALDAEGAELDRVIWHELAHAALATNYQSNKIDAIGHVPKGDFELLAKKMRIRESLGPEERVIRQVKEQGLRHIEPPEGAWV